MARNHYANHPQAADAVYKAPGTDTSDDFKQPKRCCFQTDSHCYALSFAPPAHSFTTFDVALIYYPGHLATAVCFNDDVKGDAMIINGRKFIVCDPTYIGAPVGARMPDLEYDKVQAIILKR